MMELFESLGVEMEPSDMSFSVSLDDGHGCERGTRNGFSSLFAQQKNIFNPRFLKMIREITMFNVEAIKYVEELENNQDIDRNETLKHFVQSRGYSRVISKGFSYSDLCFYLVGLFKHNELLCLSRALVSA